MDKIALLVMLVCGACATLSNSSKDHEITVTSNSAGTKFYHNGRFIGAGRVATTYASGHGTDVLSGVKKGCSIATINVQKGITNAFTLNLIPAGLAFLFGLLMTINELESPSSPSSEGVGGAFAFTIVAPIVTFMSFGMMDATSGTWRGVSHTDYDLTPTNCIKKPLASP